MKKLLEQRPVTRVLGRIEGGQLIGQRNLVAAARDHVCEALSRGHLRQLHEGAEGRDDRREGIEIRIDREDLLETGDQEDPVVGLVHHRAALA